MRGKEFKQILKLNGLTQAEAAKIFGVSRPTISIWCNSEKIDDKIVRIINDKFLIKNSDYNPVTTIGDENVVVGHDNNGNIDNRHYYSDSPDVLKKEIELLDERIKEKDAQIKEKDAQIKEKDAQINRLLSIVEGYSKK